MGDDRKRGSRVLRFAVTGALLVAPMAGCGDDEADPEINVNEPAPEPTVNEIVEPEGPVVPEPVEPTVNAPPEPQRPEPQPTPNTPAQPSE